jgi:hypothetical protein
MTTETKEPKITRIRKVLSEPEMYLLDVEGREGTVTLSMGVDVLQSYRKFHMLCMSEAHVCFSLLSQKQWFGMVNDLLSRMETIEAPTHDVDDMFLEFIEIFLTSRSRGKLKEDLLRGVPWEDEDSNRHYFSLTTLKKFLDNEGLKGKDGKPMSHFEITHRIKKLHGEAGKDETFKPHVVWTIKGKFKNYWWVPSSAISPEMRSPEMPREKI